MSDYATLLGSDQYDSKIAGSAVGVVLVNALDPSDIVVGAATSFTASQQYEQVPVEEAGNDGVDEFVDGRHAGTFNLSAFYTPQWADKVPTRQQFIDREYVILKTIAPNRTKGGSDIAGAVLDAYVGCKINAVASQHGARGAMMLDISGVFTRQYSPAEWSQLAGA